MAEWSMAVVLKTTEPEQRAAATTGSNRRRKGSQGVETVVTQW
jgi:hypothetical protein